MTRNSNRNNGPRLGPRFGAVKEYVNSLLAILNGIGIDPPLLPQGLAPEDTDPASRHPWINFPVGSATETVQALLNKLLEEDESVADDTPEAKYDRLLLKSKVLAQKVKKMEGEVYFYRGKYEDSKELNIYVEALERSLQTLLDQHIPDEQERDNIEAIYEGENQSLKTELVKVKKIVARLTKTNGGEKLDTLEDSIDDAGAIHEDADITTAAVEDTNAVEPGGPEEAPLKRKFSAFASDSDNASPQLALVSPDEGSKTTAKPPDPTLINEYSTASSQAKRIKLDSADKGPRFKLQNFYYNAEKGTYLSQDPIELELDGHHKIGSLCKYSDPSKSGMTGKDGKIKRLVQVEYPDMYRKVTDLEYSVWIKLAPSVNEGLSCHMFVYDQADEDKAVPAFEAGK
jgi:hypothetical protein